MSTRRTTGISDRERLERFKDVVDITDGDLDKMEFFKQGGVDYDLIRDNFKKADATTSVAWLIYLLRFFLEVGVKPFKVTSSSQSNDALVLQQKLNNARIYIGMQLRDSGKASIMPNSITLPQLAAAFPMHVFRVAVKYGKILVSLKYSQPVDDGYDIREVLLDKKWSWLGALQYAQLSFVAEGQQRDATLFLTYLHIKILQATVGDIKDIERSRRDFLNAIRNRKANDDYSKRVETFAIDRGHVSLQVFLELLHTVFKGDWESDIDRKEMADIQRMMAL